MQNMPRHEGLEATSNAVRNEAKSLLLLLMCTQGRLPYLFSLQPFRVSEEEDGSLAVVGTRSWPLRS